MPRRRFAGRIVPEDPPAPVAVYPVAESQPAMLSLLIPVGDTSSPAGAGCVLIFYGGALDEENVSGGCCGRLERLQHHSISG
ncbi:hypothetical protein BN874_2900009 [Candidatus Contendobacter odensis Run_B_J11]|uniref:Uncharacterized protein n=1 Tax=Candidatus Contendobacter odensis Run_B_J11 TaxID=1400861 RepID=A0A7U7J4N8_9GAMM|nr:hypothetical protein BN874_2900009 [Candidatus Contendobacter odensis Run_B_J11]